MLHVGLMVGRQRHNDLGAVCWYVWQWLAREISPTWILCCVGNAFAFAFLVQHYCHLRSSAKVDFSHATVSEIGMIPSLSTFRTHPVSII